MNRGVHKNIQPFYKGRYNIAQLPSCVGNNLPIQKLYLFVLSSQKLTKMILTVCNASVSSVTISLNQCRGWLLEITSFAAKYYLATALQVREGAAKLQN